MALVLNGSNNTIGGLAVGGLPDGVVDTDMVAANAINLAKLGATSGKKGPILQVKQTFKTDTASTSSTSFSDVFTVAITPAAASSNFLLIGDLKIGYSSYSAAIMWKFVRTVSSSDTDLFIGDAAGNRARCTWGIEDTGSGNDAKFKVASTNGMFLDTTANTPNEITYRVKWKAQQNTGYLNRTGDDADGLAYPRTASSLTVMEYDPT